MSLAKGWERESADLYIHDTGARISKSTYRGKLAWWFFPVSFDVTAVEHPPTDEGREEAFLTAEREIPKTRAKPKALPKKKADDSAEEEPDRNLDEDADTEKTVVEDKEEDGE